MPSAAFSFLLSALLLPLGALPDANCQAAKTEPEKEPVPLVAVKAVADNPEEYLKKTVRLAGRLENEGKNYFTDLKVVLKDEQGNSVYVRPWLPAELPPAPPGSTGKRPAVLSQYMGKQVELTAVLDRGTLKKVGEVYLLEVKAAKLVQ